MTLSLHIVARHAEGLPEVEFTSKNDPYAQFTFALGKDATFKRTSTKDEAGDRPEWNETVILDNFDPSKHTILYAEVNDSDEGIDPPIGYTDIPLGQVVNADGKTLNAYFDLFDEDNKAKGTLYLTLSIIEDGQAAPSVNSAKDVKGESSLTPDHQKRFQEIYSVPM
jgi:Ca2+-dependent lipid-binding protein